MHEDVASMQKIADKEHAKIKIEAWDYRYYIEKVRKAQYDLDQNEVKEYLQLDKMREAMFWAAGKVYGLEFVKVEGLPVAQADITVYEVRRDGQQIGLWYFDPYARDGKNSGAWMSEYRTQEKFRGPVTPIVSNNANFVKVKPGEPILISWDDADTRCSTSSATALHGWQSNVTYPSLAGTNVKIDFVEFPKPGERALVVDARSPQPVRAALQDRRSRCRRRARRQGREISKTFNQGFITVEYLAGALYDMKIHMTATMTRTSTPTRSRPPT